MSNLHFRLVSPPQEIKFEHGVLLVITTAQTALHFPRWLTGSFKHNLGSNQPLKLRDHNFSSFKTATRALSESPVPPLCRGVRHGLAVMLAWFTHLPAGDDTWAQQTCPTWRRRC